MGASNSRNSNPYPHYDQNYQGTGIIQPYDYPTWGYIILYLVILLGGLILNGIFLVTVKKNAHLHRTAHFMFVGLAIRDILVCIFVVPFVMQSEAANLTRWTSGDAMCKLFSFINIGTMATHSFILVFLLMFLYFWYRKQESYMTAEGQVVVRKNKLHKWAIPLAWVLGLGLAIPAGATSSATFNVIVKNFTCSVWNGSGTSAGYWIMLSVVIVAFLVPFAILIFPSIALTMQLCGSREPRLDPPHNRTAATGLALVIIFVITRAPSEVFSLMKLFHQSAYGLKANTHIGTPYATHAFETTIIMNALIYLACLLDPIMYFALNPEYRKGLVVAWKELYCNKDPVQREREEAEKRQRKLQARQYPNRNRLPPQVRHNQEKLLPQHRQPQIMGAHQGMPGYHPQQPQQPYVIGHQPYHPAQHQVLLPDQQFLDTSFERLSPQLPPVFEYDGLKYIDTARVEPNIGYSPQKTPPKTPETPRYEYKPFLPAHQEIEMVDMTPSPQPQGPIATSEPKKRESFHLEQLEGSPGSTLRTRRLREGLDETVETLTESPGSRNRRRTTQESQQSSGYQSTNGTGVSTSRPTSPYDRPQSRSSGMEIVITGRTRSRTDLCPTVPRSKFEHSV